MTVTQAKAVLRGLPFIKFKLIDGEWRVSLRGLNMEREEAVAYYTCDADDAVATATQMSRERDHV